jgi:ABC-type Fe3+-siderophore transport system permease subunit
VRFRARLSALVPACVLIASIAMAVADWFGLLSIETWQVTVAIVASCLGMLPHLLLVRNELRPCGTEF